MIRKNKLFSIEEGRVNYDPIDWLAAITSHIPDKGAQNFHYYGVYSNKSRGLRKKEQDSGNKIIIADSIPLKKILQ